MTVTRPPSVPHPALVAGLVAITPACGFVNADGRDRPRRRRRRHLRQLCRPEVQVRLDDSLDVVAVHLVGGIVGALLDRLPGHRHRRPGVIPGGAINGLFYGGGLRPARPPGRGCPGHGLATACSARRSSACAIKYTIGLRITEEQEVEGMDIALHAETAYDSMRCRLAPVPCAALGSRGHVERTVEADV